MARKNTVTQSLETVLLAHFSDGWQGGIRAGDITLNVIA